MSLWLRTRDDDGNAHHILVPFAPLAVMVLVGMGIAVLLPILQAFRQAVYTWPVTSACLVTGILLVGAMLFVTAKLSVIRAGQLVSVGSGAMSRSMRVFYFSGYTLLVLGAVGVGLYRLVV